ncbi:MAG TPA: hypothetical protein VGP22_06630, partial [Albitalea sp.]|nr:hypothetical protein [Albitalea sp.]
MRRMAVTLRRGRHPFGGARNRDLCRHPGHLSSREHPKLPICSGQDAISSARTLFLKLLSRTVKPMSIAAGTHDAAQPEPLSGGAAASAHAQYSMSRSAFWLMLRRVAVIAGCSDLMFLGVFLALGLPVLAWTNLVSVGMYAAAYGLIGRRKNRPAVVLMWTEVLLHAISCTLLLGWDSGAHYFLLVFIPAIALSRSQKLAVGALTFLLIVYLGLDRLTQVVPRAYVMSTSELGCLRALCITVVFMM